MRSVGTHIWNNWLFNGKVLEQDDRGPKVVALENGLFLKIFYTRRHPLRARWRPAARTFALNAQKLKRLGVPTPEVTDLFWLDKQKGLSACLYRPLPGISVEHLYLRKLHNIKRLLPALAEFIHKLHQAGVYFRSLHLGNIIQLPDGQFGLIDFLDLKFKRGPLRKRLISRNYQHLHRYLERRELNEFPSHVLVDSYKRIDNTPSPRRPIRRAFHTRHAQRSMQNK